MVTISIFLFFHDFYVRFRMCAKNEWNNAIKFDPKKNLIGKYVFEIQKAAQRVYINYRSDAAKEIDTCKKCLIFFRRMRCQKF